MASKLCKFCRQVIPASDFKQHREAHMNQVRPNRNTPSWRKARVEALKRDGFQCQRCHRPKSLLDLQGVQLHVHHLNGNPNDDRLENLLSLCSDCHPRGGDRRWDGIK